jgi:hypothetical protein
VVAIAVKVIVQCLGTYLEERRHVDLGFAGIICQEGVEFGVLEARANALFACGGVYFALEGACNA